MGDGAACRHVVASTLVCLAATLVLAGCHDEDRLRERLEERPAPVRLPVRPNGPATSPAPGLPATIRPWKPPPGVDTSDWQLVRLDIDDEYLVWYRVPFAWNPIGEGRAATIARTITSRAAATSLSGEQLSLETYAAQLAEGNSIQRYATDDGRAVYVTRREVSVAPSDPGAAREIFHTAVVEVDGRVVKLDVRYDESVDWRFAEIASTIVGTIDVGHT